MATKTKKSRGIQSQAIKTSDGKIKKVQIGSGAEKRYLAAGGQIISGAAGEQAKLQRSNELKAMNKPGGKVLGATVSPKVSTTTISNANKINQIPGMVQELDTFANKGVTTDAEGNPRYADGSFYQEDVVEPAKPKKTEDPYDTSDEDRQTENLLKQMQRSTDAQTKATLDNIRQKFDIRRQQQGRINTQAQKQVQNALLTGGVTGQGSSAQYAPISSVGIVQAQESYGLQQLATLDAQEQDLIFEAKAAQQEQNYRLMETKLAEIKEKRLEKIEAAKELNNAIAKKNEEDLKIQEQMDRDILVSELYANGVEDVGQILTSLRRQGVKATAKEISDSVALLSGNGGDGTIGAYNVYRKQAIAAGQVPISILDFSQRYNKAVSKTGGGSISGEVLGATTDRNDWSSLVSSLSNMESTVAGKKAVKEDVARMLNNGDYKGAWIQIANSVENKLTGTEKTNFSQARTDYEVMGGLEKAIQDYADAGGNMNLLTGKEEQIKRKLGIKADGTGKSELATQLWREFQQYRLNMTGAAFSPSESRDYASVNPTLGKNLDLNLSIIKGARAQLKNRIESTIKPRVPGAIKVLELSQGEVAGTSTSLIEQEAQAERSVRNVVIDNPKAQKAIQPLITAGIPFQEIVSNFPEYFNQ